MRRVSGFSFLLLLSPRLLPAAFVNLIPAVVIVFAVTGAAILASVVGFTVVVVVVVVVVPMFCCRCADFSFPAASSLVILPDGCVSRGRGRGHG